MISRVISRMTIVITPIMGLITPLLPTHEPPSTPQTPNPKVLSLDFGVTAPISLGKIHLIQAAQTAASQVLIAPLEEGFL